MWIWGYCAGYFKINGAIEWSFRNLWLGGWVAGLPASSFSLASKDFETTIDNLASVCWYYIYIYISCCWMMQQKMGVLLGLSQI